MKKLAFILVYLVGFQPSDAQTAAPMALPRYQFFTATGVPLAAGCIFTYVAGTTSPQATYTDASGSVQNTNPVILSAGGSATIFWGANPYKVVAKSSGGNNCASGITQWTVDNVSVANQFGTVTTGSTDASFRAAQILAGTNGTVIIPSNVTVAIDTATPISWNYTSQTLVGMGCGSQISVSGAGNLFNISAAGARFKDFCISVVGSPDRTNAMIFNVQAGGSRGRIQNVDMISSATSTSNGRFFNGDLTVTGTGEWTLEDINIYNGGTWKSALFTRASSGTFAGLTVKNLISWSGITYSDCMMVADSGTDTWKLSDIENGSTGCALNLRDSLITLPPRWIHCTDCRLEAGGPNTVNPVVKLDSFRDFTYTGGYVASGQNGFVINGGNQVKVVGTEVVNIGQHSVLLSATAPSTIFTANTFEDCGISTDNTFDCVNIANNVADFTFTANSFRRINANKPRYAFNLSGAGVGFFTIIGNDVTTVPWGTAALNNLSASNVQRIVGNPGIADFMRDSAGQPVYFNGILLGASGATFSGATSGSTSLAASDIASGAIKLPASAGTLPLPNLIQSWTAPQTFSSMQYFPGNVFFVTADFTTANNTNLQAITGLSWTMPATTALNLQFSCEVLYSQATAAVADQFGIQDVTVAPTNIAAKANVATSASAMTYGNLPTLTTTTATAFVTFTPSTFGTVFNASLSGFIEQPSNAASSAVQIMAQTSNGADAMTIKRGSWCRVF